MAPATVPRGPGSGSGGYAVRFGSLAGHLLMTVRIPCASYTVRVRIAGHTITPDPGTTESLIGTCGFPWDKEQQRMARYIQGPLQFVQHEASMVPRNSEWGVTLFRTPYGTP